MNYIEEKRDRTLRRGHVLKKGEQALWGPKAELGVYLIKMSGEIKKENIANIPVTKVIRHICIFMNNMNIPTSQSSIKFKMIAFTIKSQARNNEQKQTYRQGK